MKRRKRFILSDFLKMRLSKIFDNCWRVSREDSGFESGVVLRICTFRPHKSLGFLAHQRQARAARKSYIRKPNAARIQADVFLFNLCQPRQKSE